MAITRSTGSLLAAVSVAALLAVASGRAEQVSTAQLPPADDALDVTLTDACGGRSKMPMAACENDVNRMIRVLPEKAPAAPARPRKILVLGTSRGFQHSSIPLAAKMVEEMGKKTGAWTADVTYNRAAISAANLQQYDAIFLSSTTGTFLDEPNPTNDPAIQAVTDARRKALLDFVRGGKGLAGIHAASDSYHGNPGGRGGRAAAAGAAVVGTPAAGAAPATPAVAGGAAPAPGAPAGARAGGGGGGRGQQPPQPPCTSAQNGGGGGGNPLWPEFNKMIGGYFKHHWNYPTPITVKIDDPTSPINAAFKGKSFNTIDEVYTYNHDSFSRENVRVLTSVDYSLMTDCDKGLESNRRPDSDYALSWIRKEGSGRVFYQALGHHESIYYNNPAMLEHIMAGIQYALGDLKADDTPRPLKR